MQLIRNNSYTIYNGTELELTKNPDGKFMLIYRGKNPPDNSFIKANGCEDVFNKIVTESDIHNAFSVVTFALYKNYKFQVDRFENNKFRITTSDNEALGKLNLHFVDRGWYDTWVSPEEIERMWEERKPSGLNFPFPHDLAETQEISFKS
ncbi:MAG: hypothetical protein M3Q56_08020 [Bacteroidota bacterium]|nr:hypothetical protein [Bacteroidota bacterium]